MTSHRATTFAAPLVCAAFAAPAQAAFVGGVERFDGQTLDAETWALRDARPGDGRVTQDDHLRLDATGEAGWIDYTTRTRDVELGEAVRATLTLGAEAGFVSLLLTNNSTGGDAGQTTLDDSAFLRIAIDPDAGVNTRAEGPGLSTGASLRSGATPLGQPLVYEIARLDADAAQFAIFEPGEEAPLFVESLEISGFTEGPLLIALAVSGGDATFDDVAVVDAVFLIPTPAATPLAAALAGVVALRRRR